MSVEIDGVNGIIKNTTSDGDVTIKGNDGGSEISALILDMSDAGTATFNHDIKLGDSSELVFGAGNDLKIYHDGSNSYVKDNGTGGLVLQANADFNVQSTGTNENMIYGASNAFVKLYHNGNEKIATTSTGIDVTGTVTSDGASLDGAVVINEASADVDFRVESNGNTHMLFVDGGNNRVGFITAPDLGNVHIRVADTGGSSNNDADELVLEQNAACGLTILSANNSQGNIFFGDAQDNDVGRIIYNHSNNNMSFRSNATEFLRADEDGHVTMPKQPAFLVPGTTQDNIASGISTVSFGGTERFDQNADFNTSNYTFTAPITGKYYFSVKVQLGNLDNTHDYCRTHLVTSNNTYYLEIISPDKIFSADVPYVSFQNSMLVDMDAGDTAYVQINLNGGNGGQADLTVSQSYFSGYLAC